MLLQKSTQSSDSDIEIMFSEEIQTYHWIYGYYRTHTRNGLQDNQPTCNQAEILFFGRIPPECIEIIEEI